MNKVKTSNVCSFFEQSKLKSSGCNPLRKKIKKIKKGKEKRSSVYKVMNQMIMGLEKPRGRFCYSVIPQRYKISLQSVSLQAFNPSSNTNFDCCTVRVQKIPRWAMRAPPPWEHSAPPSPALSRPARPAAPRLPRLASGPRSHSHLHGSSRRRLGQDPVLTAPPPCISMGGSWCRARFAVHR